MFYKIECLGGHPAFTSDGDHGFSFKNGNQYVLTFVEGVAVTERSSIAKGLDEHFPGKFAIESMRSRPDTPDFVPVVNAPAPAIKPRKAATSKRILREANKASFASNSRESVFAEPDGEAIDPTEE